MPTINIDELVEPIEVIVGGETYIVEDIPQSVAKRINAIGIAAIKAEADGVADDDSSEKMAEVMADILGAKPESIKALGMRKLLKLTTTITGTLTDEVSGKNSPEDAAMK